MVRFIFKGEDVNLGRFGFVRKGDEIVLTDQEADMVRRDGDKRFELVVPGKTKQSKKGNFIELSSEMTADQRAAAIASNKAEQERLDQLAKANDEEKVRVEEIKTMTFEQLVALAEQMNAEAKRDVVPIEKKMSKGTLVQRILAARGQNPELDEQE